MHRQKGFVGILALLLSVVVLAVVMAIYAGYLDTSLLRFFPNNEGGIVGEQAVVKKVVEFRLESIKTQEVATARVSVVPSVSMGYRLTLMETDYETYATILIENVPLEVYKTVTVRENDTQVVNGLLVSITRFITAVPESPALYSGDE